MMNDMTDTLQESNSRYWAETWQKTAAHRAKDRGPMQAGFWNGMAQRFGQDRPAEQEDGRLKNILDLIGTTGLDLDGAEVLDIGAGTGALSIPLARRGAKVTALDFSPEMVKKLKRRAADEQVILSDIHLASWDVIDLDAEGFRNRFDLVIASMTPAVRDPETFDKMLDASRGVGYYSGWVHREWDPAFHDLYRILFNEPFREDSHGFYLPFMYLYMKGYRPEVRIRQDVWKSEGTIDEMIETISGFFSLTKEIDDEMKIRMREYLTARAPAGVCPATTVATTGMMVWDKNAGNGEPLHGVASFEPMICKNSSTR
jgi:SAM-dependent methyltransferase